MLEKLVIIPHVVLSFITTQSDLPFTPQYISQHQKPPIYAHAPEDLTNRLISQSTEKVVPEQGPSQEQDITNFHYYINLAFKKDAKKLNIRQARQFLDYFIEKYKESSSDSTLAGIIPKALLYSGILYCCMETEKNFPKSIERLKEASALAIDINIKARAFFVLGNIEQYNANAGVEGFSLRKAIEFYGKVITVAPESDYAKESKERIKLIEPQKHK